MALISNYTGIGVSGKDKLQDLTPAMSDRSEAGLLDWYRAVSFIQKPIDIFAEEMFREGFKVETGNDSADDQIECCLNNLNAVKKFIQLEKNKMIFRNGGLLYYGFDSMIPQTDSVLDSAVPADGKLCFMNVLPAYDFYTNQGGQDPLRKNYYDPQIMIRGNQVHKSRYAWHVNNYDGKYNKGLSLVDGLVEIAKGMDITVWSLVNMVYESQVKVYKSDPVVNGGKNIVTELINKIRSTMSSQSVAVIKENESFDKMNFTAQGLDQVLNFFWEVLGALSPVTANVLKGQNKRVLSLQNDPDMISYYSNVQSAQQNAEKAYLRKTIDYICQSMGLLHEYEIKWLPLYMLDDNTKADIALKTAQTDVQYITSGVLNPQDVLSERFPDIGTVSNNPDTDFEIPDLLQGA